MKKTFLRILPLTVAVLLATSCSKDNDNATEVVNNWQETVQTKTYPISITVNQKGLSKLRCTGAMGEALQPTFEITDQLVIYKGGALLKELTPTTISEDGKTAIFEDEIVANGLVDGETVLTAKIGTPITAAVTATSREDAVKKGCYQTADFIYSAEGNHISLEEQNAYIEVIWTNKGNSTVDFTIGGKPVSLTLNAQGQGWIVVPDGVTLTCEALGIAEAKTTEKANIYGIIRKFVPDGYVDLGVVLDDGTEVYFEKSESYTTSSWTDLQNENKLGDLPKPAEWAALKNQCYWHWTGSGYNVFKVHDQADAGKGTYNNHTPSKTYSTDTDPYIFLPVIPSWFGGYYWSGSPYGDGYAYCLIFNEGNVNPEDYGLVSLGFSVLTVRRSN